MLYLIFAKIRILFFHQEALFLWKRTSVVLAMLLQLACGEALADIKLQDISRQFTPLFNKGSYAQIIAEAGSMLNILPLSESEARMGCFLFMADAYFALGEREKAYEFLAMAKDVNPRHMAPYFMEARLLTKEGRAQEAYDQCRESSLTLDPDQGHALVRDCLEMLLKSRTVEAYKLWQDFHDDAQAAQEKYVGTLIAVRGKIVDTAKTDDGGLDVTLSVGADKDGAIKCSFSESGAANPNLVKGRILLISGLCRGIVLQKVVLLSGCSVVGQGPARLN